MKDNIIEQQKILGICEIIFGLVLIGYSFYTYTIPNSSDYGFSLTFWYIVVAIIGINICISGIMTLSRREKLSLIFNIVGIVFLIPFFINIFYSPISFFFCLLPVIFLWIKGYWLYKKKTLSKSAIND